MDVALLHYTAPPVVGGVERVLGEHARLMADAGHKVRVIAGRGQAFDPRIEFFELPIVDSRNPGVLQVKSALDGGSIPAAFEALVDRIYDGLRDFLVGADVLVAHNVCSLNKNLALTAAVRRMAETAWSPRPVLWHHDLAWTTSRYARELHDGYPWSLLRTDLPGATHVTVSEWRRNELAALLGITAAAIRVVPNGLAPSTMLKLEPKSRQLADRFELLEADPLILTPVRVTRRKNIELAIRTLGGLRERFPAARLVVTGPLGAHNPANQEYLDQLIQLRSELALQGAVHLLAETEPDPIPGAVVADLYSLSDALLLPSSEEGFGIPVLEAGLARIPVFCTDIAALREIGGAEAHYFACDAPAADVAKAIATVLESSPLYSARKRVLKHYTWEHVYSEHIAPLLESLGP